MPLYRDTPEGVPGGARPFASAEDAWLWTMAALMARRDGAGPVRDAGAVARPCEPADVLACLERLRRARRIDRDDIHTLQFWGRRGTPPGPNDPPSAVRVWHELMRVLHSEFHRSGVVAAATEGL